MTKVEASGELAMADPGGEALWGEDWTRDFTLFAGLDEALRHAIGAEMSGSGRYGRPLP